MGTYDRRAENLLPTTVVKIGDEWVFLVEVRVTRTLSEDAVRVRYQKLTGDAYFEVDLAYGQKYRTRMDG